MKRTFGFGILAAVRRPEHLGRQGHRAPCREPPEPEGRRVPRPARQGCVILDNCVAHMHGVVTGWLAEHPRWLFRFTPTSCSWISAVEGFFQKAGPSPTLARDSPFHKAVREINPELHRAAHRERGGSPRLDGKCGTTHRRRQKDTFRLIHAACSEPADVSDDHALTGLCTGTLRCRFDDCELLVRGSSVLLRTGKGFNTDNFRRAFGSSCSSGPLLRVSRQVFWGGTGAGLNSGRRRRR